MGAQAGSALAALEEVGADRETTHALEHLGPVLKVEVGEEVLLILAFACAAPLLGECCVLGLEEPAWEGGRDPGEPSSGGGKGRRAHWHGWHLY